MSPKTIRDLEINNDKTSGEDFPSLEEKIYKAIELLKAERSSKAVAERDAGRLREQLEQREEELETLRAEIIVLRKEREEVRSRVEQLLRHVDSLISEAEPPLLAVALSREPRPPS